jgi:hypothetical protein
MQGWYAQKHPMKILLKLLPSGSRRVELEKQYEGWELKKLEYIDRIAQLVGPLQPKLGELDQDRPVSELKVTFVITKDASKEYPKA